MKQTLIQFGFIESEALLYMALLKLSEATIDECVEISNIKRTTAYSNAKKLVEKGVIAEIFDKPVRYRVIPPEIALKRVIQDRIRETKRLSEEMETLSDELIEQAQKDYEEQSARSDPSQELIITKGLDIYHLLTRPFIVQTGSTKRIMTKVPIINQKDAKTLSRAPNDPDPISRVWILFETEMLRIDNFRDSLRRVFASGKHETRHLTSLPLKMMIYGEVGSIISMERNETPDDLISILTQNKMLVESHIHAFDFLWHQATPFELSDLEEYQRANEIGS